MKNTNPKTPTDANYRILELIEQIVEAAPKGTDLGLCDLGSALVSGHFIEMGGAVTPAVESFLRGQVSDEEERAARTRRAAKALTYGSYNVNELVGKVREIVEEEGKWKATQVQGYKVKAVDFTAYRRGAVKKLQAKAYVADTNKAVEAVPIGLIASVGAVGGQRIALLDDAVVTKLDVHDGVGHKKQLYRQVAKGLADDEVAVFDAGFKLVEAMTAGIKQCVVRLAKNVTLGKTVGKIPPRTSPKGPEPTQYQAEIVRPLARKHGDNLLPATAADEICELTDEHGYELEIHIWHKLYFLERQLNAVTSKRKKRNLRRTPLKVFAIHHPNYEHPLLLGTPLLELEPLASSKIYASRWPVEGLPQTGKYILSGGGGTHYVHHPTAMQRLPFFSLLFGSLLKYVAATLPPFRTGFWDRAVKPTYGRLLRHLKKVAIPLSVQLFKKDSYTAHLPVGYAAIRLKPA